MNLFDDESKIIEFFQDCLPSEVYFPVKSWAAVRIYKSVHALSKWKFWRNNSGKSDPPPDFYSEKFQLMMEVMRVDDHARINEKGKITNPTNERESKLQKEIRQKISSENPEIDLSKLNIFVNAVTDLPSVEDHNYKFYCDNFARVLERHIKHIPLYRDNHPSKKLVFFIMDESTGYIQVEDAIIARRGPIAGEPILADPVWHFLDKRIINTFADANIDYIIWFTPYKMFHGTRIQPPKVCVFDMKKIKQCKTIDYPKKYIVSSEA